MLNPNKGKLETVSSEDVKELKYKPINSKCKFEVTGRVISLRAEGDEIYASFDVEKIKYIGDKVTDKEAMESSFDSVKKKKETVVKTDWHPMGGS